VAGVVAAAGVACDVLAGATDGGVVAVGVVPAEAPDWLIAACRAWLSACTIF